MKLTSTHVIKSENYLNFYFKLLSEEDFDFKGKDIKFFINKLNENKVEVEIKTNSILNLKIGNSVLIKSLEIINKTLQI